MSRNNKNEIDYLLQEWSDGDIDSENKLINLLYPEIHKIAHFQIKSHSARALQTTELVSEAFIRLNAQKSVNWQNKNHFLAIASKVIRRVVVDFYRSELSLKRGGLEKHITLSSVEELVSVEDSRNFDWLSLDELMKTFYEIDEDAASVVEYKIFGGMTIPEIAEAMKVSESTVSRNWKFARTWLIQHYKQHHNE